MNKKNWPDQIRQHVRSLCGVMLFLLMLKSATVLRVFRVMATFAALVAGSLSRLFWLMVNLNRHKTWDIYGIYTVRSISVEYIRRIFELGLLWYVARQKGLLLLLDFKYYPDGGAVQYGEPPVQPKVQQLRHTFRLPPISAVSSEGWGGWGPPLLLGCFPLSRTSHVLDSSVDVSGTELPNYNVCQQQSRPLNWCVTDMWLSCRWWLWFPCWSQVWEDVNAVRMYLQ